MAKYLVEVERTVVLVVDADSPLEATRNGAGIAWKWQPEEASGGDQGHVRTKVVGEDG